MRFRIEGKEYPSISTEEATLAELLAIKRDTGLTRGDLNDLQKRVAEMTEEEADESDDALLVMGIGVWLSRRRAGETGLSLEDACNFPLSALEVILEPGDEEAIAADAEARADAADPTRTASDPRGTRPPTDDHRSKRKTSRKVSASA